MKNLFVLSAISASAQENIAFEVNQLVLRICKNQVFEFSKKICRLIFAYP